MASLTGAKGGMARDNVISLQSRDGDIEPPEGWRAKSPFGHLSIDDTRAGRLARLGDVLKWLEEAHEWPRERALQELLDRLPSDARAWLFGLREGKFAEPVHDGHMFGFHTQEQHDAAKRAHEAGNYQSSHQGRTVRSPGVPRRWDGGGDIAPGSPITPYCGPPVSEPGLPALRLLLTCWKSETLWVPALRQQKDTTEFQGAGWLANYLAVPLRQAFEWWGYGRRDEADDKPHTPRQTETQGNPGAEQWALLSEELRADWLNVLSQRSAREAGKKGVKWTPFQVVTAALVVQTINQAMPSKGLAVAADALGFKAVESLREKLTEACVRDAKKALDAERRGPAIKRNTWIG